MGRLHYYAYASPFLSQCPMITVLYYHLPLFVLSVGEKDGLMYFYCCVVETYYDKPNTTAV